MRSFSEVLLSATEVLLLLGKTVHESGFDERIYILKEEKMFSTLDYHTSTVSNGELEFYKMSKSDFTCEWWDVPFAHSRKSSVITNLAYPICNTATTKKLHLKFQFKHSETLI